MKKFIIASLLLFATQGIFAQLDWSQLSEDYSKTFLLAERVAEQTEKVSADEKGIGIVIKGGVVTLERSIDSRSTTQEDHRFKLIKSDGNKIPLDKISTEKVLEKYKLALEQIDEKLKADRKAQVEDILNSLFN